MYNFFSAAPMAYGGSQARGLIGAVATGLRQSHSHSHTRCEPPLRPTPQSLQRGIQSSVTYTEAHATATATPNPSRICDLPHSSWQCRILNPLSEARARTHNLMVPSRIRFHCATDRNSL